MNYNNNSSKIKSQITIVVLFFSMGIAVFYAQENNANSKNTTQDHKDLFRNKIMVVAHRGDWRNAPENSLPAIQNCIKMGVDMVEIDLQRTKDGTIILMHDKSLDRTSTGKGLIKDTNFESIDSLRLKNGYGMATTDKVPTLLEALKLCKNKVLVFLDKNYNYLPEVVKMVKEQKMEDQVFYEGKNTFNDISAKYGTILDGINYMPRVSPTFSDDTYMKPFLEIIPSPIFIFSFHKKELNEATEQIKKTKKAKGRIMITTLWDNTAGGYTDDLAVYDPEANWGKVIELGADLICTDRPEALIQYLRKKGFHD
jgi:glycerophosphoryl diester phosphodiesterase